MSIQAARDEYVLALRNAQKEYRELMFAEIRKTKKPCLVLKILGAGRLCLTPEATDAAFKTAFSSIKPNDCVIVGIYPKHRDQIGEDAALVRKYSSLSDKNANP